MAHVTRLNRGKTTTKKIFCVVGCTSEESKPSLHDEKRPIRFLVHGDDSAAMANQICVDDVQVVLGQLHDVRVTEVIGLDSADAKATVFFNRVIRHLRRLKDHNSLNLRGPKSVDTTSLKVSSEQFMRDLDLEALAF